MDFRLVPRTLIMLTKHIYGIHSIISYTKAIFRRILRTFLLIWIDFDHLSKSRQI
jgi:hypothetical protein